MTYELLEAFSVFILDFYLLIITLLSISHCYLLDLTFSLLGTATSVMRAAVFESETEWFIGDDSKWPVSPDYAGGDHRLFTTT